MNSKVSVAAEDRRPSILLTLLVALLTFTVGLEPAYADKGKRKQRKEEKKQKKGAELEQYSYNPGPGWEAYFEDEDGFRMKIITPLEQNEDKDWMGLRFTDYKGPKLRLAVMQVDNRSPYHETVPLDGIESLIASGLAQTGRFDLVERERIGEVLNEQDLGDSDRIGKPSAAKIGQVLGAQYQVFATIVEWTPNKTNKKSNGGAHKSQAEVAITVRVVGANTSKTLFTKTERATAGSWGIGLFRSRTGGGGNLGMNSNAPLGYAVQSSINKAVYRLAMGLKDQKWRGSVMNIAGRTVYINAGEDLGMQVGYRLTCLSKGEALVEPATGVELGFTMSAIGTLTITGVEEAYSIAEIVNGCQGLKYGDFVEFESTGEQKTAAASP